MFSIIIAGMKQFFVAVSVITLMLGGIGVMNIMLIAVKERTREIGIRKALGARRCHILFQFLLERMTITFVGGMLGILFSYLLTWLIGTRPFVAGLLDDPSGQTDIQLRLSAPVLLTAASILVMVSLLSGLWPAIRATRMDPIEFLRYE